MAGPRVLGFLEFREAMVYELRWDPARLNDREKATLKRLINSAVQKVSFPLTPGTDAVYQWNWLDPIRQLIVRPLVTGTLLDVPTRSGDLIILRAKEAVFDADLVGHDLTMDATGQRYKIVDFIGETSVKLVPSPRSPKGQLTQLGARVNGTFVGVTAVAGTSTITESHATEKFHLTQVGWIASFAGGSDYPIIRSRGASPNRTIDVEGDAFDETGNVLTVKRTLDSTSTSTSSLTGTVKAPSGTFEGHMTTDTITFTVSGNTYTIESFVTSAQVSLTAVLAAADVSDSPLEFTIKKSYSTDYSVAANVSETTITVDDDIFTVEHEGLYLAFFNIAFDSFQIREVVDANTVRLLGDVSDVQSIDNAVSVVRAAGRLSTSVARGYDGVTTLLTSTAAVFSSGMAGLAIEFLLTQHKYAITEFVTTTSIRVAGDASQEGSPKDFFFVVGPTDLAANDAFTVVNTGQDYEFDDNFGGIDGPVTFSVDDGSIINQLTIRSPSIIATARSRRSDTGVPVMASVVPQVHDGRFVHRMILQLVPGPDAVYRLNFRQIIVQPDISEDVPYPPGGALYGELYKAACLVEVESEIRGIVKGPFRATFVRQLAAMIQLDSIGTAPEFIGRGYEEGAPSLSVSPSTRWNRADPIYTPGVD